MEKAQLLSALRQTKETSGKRNFKQSYDLIMNFKGLDLKKPDHQVDTFVVLPKTRGRKLKVCAIVGPELTEQAKGIFDSVITAEQFDKYKDKKEVKKLSNSADFFIAQANIMAKVATVFGRVFGPRGKMPNPKAGAVVLPNANLKPVYEKFQNTVRASAKIAPMIQVPIGTEDMSIEDVAENAMTVYKQVLSVLPNEKHNVKDICVKLTMGKPVKLHEVELEAKHK
jgi:large subunit ribosomal protein L1